MKLLHFQFWQVNYYVVLELKCPVNCDHE